MHLDVEAVVAWSVEQLKHELFDILGRQPSSAQPHGNFAGGQIDRLYSSQRLCVDAEPAVRFCRLFRFPQLVTHIAGKVFIRRHINGGAFVIRHLRELEHYAVQFLNQGRFIFSGQFCHIGDIDPGFFGKRQRQCLGCGIHPADTDFLLNGAFGEHIRLADKVAIAVHDLQRTQQKIGVIIVKCRVVGSLGDSAIFLYKSIVQTVQPLLFCSDQVFRIILRLVLNELPDTIPQPD